MLFANFHHHTIFRKRHTKKCISGCLLFTTRWLSSCLKCLNPNSTLFLFTSTLSLTTTGESTTCFSLLCYSNQLFMCGEHTQLTWLGGEPLGCRGLLYIFFLLFYGFSFCFCCFDLLCMYVCVCSFNNILWGEYLVVCICS